MKPIPKIERRCCVRFSGAFLFLSLTLLLQLLPSESVFAQQWVEGNWQRRSGNATQFQNSFPDQHATLVIQTLTEHGAGVAKRQGLPSNEAPAPIHQAVNNTR